MRMHTEAKQLNTSENRPLQQVCKLHCPRVRQKFLMVKSMHDLIFYKLVKM